MKIIKHLIVLILFVGVCGYLLYSSYSEVKSRTIEDFNKIQLVYAQQAAVSIKDFFDHFSELLNHLTQDEDVIENNTQGQKLLQFIYNSNLHDIASIARIDNKGKIVSIYPDNKKYIGVDLSNLEHVKEVLKTHKPTISDVFTSVQGYQSVAVVFPIFKDKIFQGMIGILIPFENISKRFLETIKIGKDGYARLLSQKGIELYCPVPGHVGTSIFENIKNIVSLIALSEKMTRGEQGEGVYFHSILHNQQIELIKKYAVYFPVKLKNTFWSIIVETPEKDILDSMKGFRDSWIAFSSILFVIAIGWSTYTVRSIIRHKEELKRKKIEFELIKSDDKLRRITENLPDMIYRMSVSNGEYEYVSPASTKVLGFTPDEFYQSPLLIFKIIHPDWKEYLSQQWEKLIAGDVPPYYEYQVISKSGETKWIYQRNILIKDENNQVIAIEGIASDITERKKTEISLKNAEEEVRSIFNVAPIGIGITINRIIKTTNNKFCKMVGYDINELIGQETRMLYINNEHYYHVGKEISRQISERGSGTIEIQLKKKNGLLIDTLFSFTPIELLNLGKGIIFTALDITEKKQSEKSIKESEAKYRQIVETANEGIWGMDQEYQTTYVNLIMAKMLGYEPHNMIGKKVTSFMFPEDLIDHDNKMHKRQQGIDSKYERRFKKKDGNEIWTLVSARALMDNEDKFAGSFAMFTDITERKIAENALKEAEEKYRNIFENAIVGIYQTTPEGKFISANPAFASILGYDSPQDLISSINNIGQQLYVDHNQRRKIMELLDISGEVKGFPANFHKKNNEVINVLIDAKVFKTPDNKGHYYQGSMIDISEKTRLEEAQKKLESQLRQSQKMEAIGTLAGGIAHDFNNILMAIIGYTEMSLNQAQIGSKISRYLEQVRKAGDRAKNLVEQILTFSRQQEGDRKPLELTMIIKEALKLIRASLPATIEIQMELNSNEVINADPTQMHQIIMNLSTNAFHAMPHGGILKVSLEDVEVSSNLIIDLPSGNYVKVQIADTGEGIDPAIIERIFEPYFTTKEVGHGTGMGLAVVSGIVKSHGGNITVESKLGQGTIFTLYFPVAEKEEIVLEGESINEVINASGRILFVDDEISIAEFAKDTLETMGFEVVNLTSSLEAIDLIRRETDRFDLIITDLTMPKLTGIELAHQVKEFRPNMPIILCTGYRDKFSKEDIEKVGVNDILIKPIGLKELGAAVQRVLKD